MWLRERESTLCKRAGIWGCVTLTVVFLVVATPGCSKVEEEKRTDSNGSAQSSRDVNASPQNAKLPEPRPEAGMNGATKSEETPMSLPAMHVDPEASTVDEKYPQLASGALAHAKLVELSDRLLLRAGDVLITQKDIDAELAKAPAELREQLRKNALFLLEQMATQKLLVQEARQAGNNPAGDERALVQSYFQTLVKDARVSDREVAEFYRKNRDMVGQATLEQVTEQVRQYLLQQKQREMVDQHIRNLGRRTTIAVSADWVDAQAALAGDNPVDKARESGRPTFANFGAQGCVPCDMMEPMREEIREEYEGKLNVVFVHVGEEQILASRYGVQGIPLLIFFDADGKEVHRHTGYMEREKIEEQLAALGVK